MTHGKGHKTRMQVSGQTYVSALHLPTQLLLEVWRRESCRFAKVARMHLGLVVLVLSVLYPSYAKAQSITQLHDSLDAAYAKARTLDEKILITKNILDICISTTADSINNVAERLYQLGKQAGRTDVMLEAARNTWTKDAMKKMQKRIASLPNSIDKRCTELALRIDITFMENNTLSMEGRQAVISKMLSQLEEQKPTDIYDRYYMIYVICRTAYGSEQSLMLSRFLDELVETAPKLQSKYDFLLTSAYRTAYNCYAYTNNKEKAVEAVYKRIAATDRILEGYRKEGRTHRDFTRFRMNDLAQIYMCHSVLTKKQIDDCYKEIKETVRKQPDYLTNDDALAHKLYTILAIHEGRWKDASKYLNQYVDNIDELLATEGYVDMGEGINIPILEVMSEIYTHLGDKDRLLRTRILLTEYYRRIIANMKRYNYQHLGIRMQILDMEVTNKELELRNKEKQEQDKLLELEIEQTKLTKLHQEQLHKIEQLRLDSLTNATQLSQAKMRNEAHRENEKSEHIKVISICAVAGIILLTLVLIIIFIIGMRRRQRNLRKVKIQLEAERLRAQTSDEDRTRFLQSIRHEVGTPLNIIMGMAEQLASMTDDDESEEMKLLSQMIRENGQQLMALINDILDLSLLQSGEYNIQLEDINIANTCETLINSVQHNCQEGVGLTFKSMLPADTTLRTDPVRFRQLITNLLTNACKYTQVGEICLSAEKEGTEALRFCVTDTGIGIKTEDAERIFNRYEKLGSTLHGSGLGLNICRVIAEKLNGNVFLDTSYKDGARFVFIHPNTTN